MQQGSSDLSGSQSALTCLCVCARAQLGLREFNIIIEEKILLKKPGKHLRKLEAPRTGPHTVTAIYTNGRVRIQKGKINERVNIRRFFPYFEDANH
jgi:hypothetical protein